MPDAFAMMNTTEGVGGALIPQHVPDYDVTAFAGNVVSDNSPRWAGRVWADQSVLDAMATEDDVAMDATQAMNALNTEYDTSADRDEWERRLSYDG